MEKYWLERTELLIKKEGIENLKNAHVLIVGMGGVGSFAAEFIARAGVGAMTIVDGDVVDITNKNRQLPALTSTVGKSKVEVMANRLMDINPELKLTVVNEFISPERAFEIVDNSYDYVVDCIDSITPKVNLILACKRKRVKVVSSMGAGGKMNPALVKVSDIHNTRDCYLAKTVRKRLAKEGIQKGVKAIFSTELQDEESLRLVENQDYKKSFYGTISYMPAIFGLYAASEVINYLINKTSSEINPEQQPKY
ncbi:MAG: tRNA threonylcarbamoyladenosine dehydratase [Flavobacteriaceae bacterium]|nr:tRNA threonylcarbamoyladenosine dehydratase [Flavobacteriaceae bacterium]